MRWKIELEKIILDKCINTKNDAAQFAFSEWSKLIKKECNDDDKLFRHYFLAWTNGHRISLLKKSTCSTQVYQMNIIALKRQVNQALVSSELISEIISDFEDEVEPYEESFPPEIKQSHQDFYTSLKQTQSNS